MSEPLELLASCLSKLQDASSSQGRTSLFTGLFPSIICVGSQSAGKSSIIETIVGHAFLPRGGDIVTRLHQTRDGETVRIVFARDPKYNLEESLFFKFDEVSGEIERRTEKRVGTLKNISGDEILLDIYSPKYPDLQFVDLPGFTRTKVDGQDEDIVHKILDLNLQYMKDPNTVILAIQDGTQDIGNSEALTNALREDVDPEGRRTVGVLTKLDLLRCSSDKERVARVLENKTKHLELGYFGVVSRSQDDIDNNIDVGESRVNQELMSEPAFQKARGLGKLGTDSLRRFITELLANKVEKLMPGLEQDSREELLRVENLLKKNGRFDDANIDYDDVIAKLVEEAMARIKLNLEGLNTTVDIRAIGAGASLNEIIKKGVIGASREARQTYKVQEFHDQLMIAKRNILGYRDTILPQELVLEIGVSLLTECYRNPMKILLEDSYEYLKNSIKTVLGDTLGVYQKFEELVGDIILGEIEENKAKAEEYLDLQINLHKRFVNTEHKEFVKSTNVLKKKIRFEPAVDLWFQEGISGDSEENVIEEKKEDEVAAAPNLVNLGIQNVRGFVNRLEKKVDVEDDQASKRDVSFIKLPAEANDEAQMHMDLCLEYMEIVDKALVDQIPKIFILMLVKRSLDFLSGGDAYKTSLLRKVQKECQDEKRKREILEKSLAHEEMIRNLKKRQKICIDTMRVIQDTMNQLKLIKKRGSI